MNGDLAKALPLALQHHQAGRFAEAEAGYQQILASHPDQPDALHLLGVLYGEMGRRDQGIPLIVRACQLSPNFAPYYNNLGNALRVSGQLDRAIAAFQRAIQLKPDYAEAYNNLGNALDDKRQFPQALNAYHTALRINPRLDRVYSNLGVTLGQLDRFDESIAALHKATELNPNSAAAYDNLGIALRENGQLDASLVAHSRALALKPDSPFAHNNMSITLKDLRRLDEAEAACRRAISLKGDYAEALNNLGVALAEQGRADEAIESYRGAIFVKPDYAGARTNLGASLGDMGQFAQSLAESRQAVADDPGNALAHLNLALILLLLGDFEHGWPEYEWRWKCRGLLPRRHFPQPRWDGSALQGKTLLLYAEQGLGDAIQFIRYVPLIVDRGGRVIVQCDGRLHRLFKEVSGISALVANGDLVPAFDLHCPIVSVAGVIGTRLESIPADIPYLKAIPRLVEEWKHKIGPTDGQLKVGLAWAGKPDHKKDKERSLRLEQLASLASEGVTFYSLQKGAAESQAANPPAGMRLIDLTPALFDFADTAGLIANLDLVITVDTGVAHLAGAMGKPVWTLLAFNPDWRWLLDRDDTPWYPTMRLFRQRKPGDWQEVIGRVREALGGSLSA